MKLGMVFFISLCAVQAFAAEETAVAISTTPVVSIPWKLTLASENYGTEMDQRNFGSHAPVVSYNWLGVRYSPSTLWEFDLRQQFQIVAGKENLAGRDARLHQNSAVQMAELVLRASVKPTPIFGSNFTMFEMRYYAPTDSVAQQNRENGRLRADAWLEWAVNNKFTIAGWVSPRVQFNSEQNPNRLVGADAEYYMLKAAPYFIYNVNDHIAPYYAYNLVEKSTQAQRGNWEPDGGNLGAHEIGLNLNYGAFLINPSLISETNLENGSGSIMTSDSRAYSYENLSYNLNVYATF